MKGDSIDAAMAQFVNTRGRNYEIPFVRESAGVYRFGSRRVVVKLENGLLAIRVGGGFIGIDEFVDTYTPAELEKLLSKSKRLSYSSARDSQLVASHSLGPDELKNLTNLKGSVKFSARKFALSTDGTPLQRAETVDWTTS